MKTSGKTPESEKREMGSMKNLRTQECRGTINELILPLEKKSAPVVLGMGFFDCVHIGHRQLISRVDALSKKLNAKRAITTFSNNPYKLFNSESKLIYTYGERLSLFEETGVDYCVPFKFDAFFKAIERGDFIKMLFDSLNVVGIVCGYDYLFGRGGQGGTAYLEEICADKGIALEVVEPVIFEGERVSSTIVKECIISGDIEKANILLTKPYFMTGKVVPGRGVGRDIGFPTANLSYHKDKMLLKHGVYLTQITVEGVRKKSLTNIGTKPTFGESSVSVETFIENESGELYGKDIKLEFSKFLRDVSKFASPAELAEQIKKDLSSY